MRNMKRSSKRLVRKILEYPQVGSLNVDDPQTTFLRRDMIQQKAFLKRIYEEWYGWIASCIPDGEGRVLELGSGAGFLDEYIPDLISSEAFLSPFAQVIMDARALPFPARSLKSIVMVDVFHHIPDVRAFMKEASDSLIPGGKILMVEPWVTPWSCYVYKNFHHEHIDVESRNWSFTASGPLSGANSALPWIVFSRDRRSFESEFPELRIEGITIEKPFAYLLSGGLSFRSFMPGVMYGLWNTFENMLSPWMAYIGMFARIDVSRVEQVSRRSTEMPYHEKTLG